MLPRFVSLTPQARQHFGLARNPFATCTEIADVFLSADTRYVREAINGAVRHNGFLAIIGESGAGKSTLCEELQERLRDDEEVILIKPYVQTMESTDAVGKTMRSLHIAEAVMRQMAPLGKQASSPQARFSQLHQTVIDSHRTGKKHVILIEEAHAIPVPTLRHLKRWMELKDGMRPLFSIVLFGQPELERKLSLLDPEVREVAQRIEIVHLQPLGTHLHSYLKHRFDRVGVKLDQVIDDGGLEALRARLTPSAKARNEMSLLYPLAVHNTLAAAMNAAAELGAPIVTRDVVGGAR